MPTSTAPHPRRSARLVAAALALLACPAWAQSPPAPPPGPPPASQPSKPQPSKPQTSPPPSSRTAEEQAEAIQQRAFAALDRGDHAQAADLLREAIRTDASNFVFYYNLACVLALQHKQAESADMLIDAVEHGFVDYRQLTTDPQLALTRREPRIAKLLESWPTVAQRHRDANLRAAERMFEDKQARYQSTLEERLRIAVMSAMDAKSTEQARADLAGLFDWGVLHVFPELAEKAASDRDAWCVVILPTPRDFLRWIVSTYGADAVNSFAGIGGSYIHDQKRLVAQDLGATLRHEFFHVLHWRSMSRLGQEHPIWIQEGLCSLVEDYEPGPTGKPEELKPVPSWRSNMARRIMTGGKLLPIKQLAALPRERFTGSSPLANYAQARTFFLYLYSAGKLKEWYATYTTDLPGGYAADRSGVRAIEVVFGKPIAEVDKAYKTWLRALPDVAEQNKPGAATLSVDVEQGDGDGPVIAAIPKDERNRPNPARRAGLRVGDVITAIDGKPTRDLNELVRLLGEKQAGDEVEVSYRRGKAHATTRVALVPR